MVKNFIEGAKIFWLIILFLFGFFIFVVGGVLLAVLPMSWAAENHNPAFLLLYVPIITLVGGLLGLLGLKR